MTLYITEFYRLITPSNVSGHPQAVPLPPVAEQVVAIGGASAQSAVFGNSTRMVRLHAGAACHVAVGKDPTATTESMPLAAGQTEYFGVTPGDKIAVIQAEG